MPERWRKINTKKKRHAETLHICLGTMSEPAFESVGLKVEADLALSTVKWFSGLTVADATDSAAPLGARSVSQPWLLSKYTYLPPASAAAINNNTAGGGGAVGVKGEGGDIRGGAV